MIFFDGIDIQSVAGVKVEDIRVSPVQINPTTRTRAISPGAYFVRNRLGTRTVAITFALLQTDRNARQRALMGISQWAKSDREYRLELPGYPGLYLMAVCTGKPEPSMRQWWEAKLRLVFTCFENPFWTDTEEKSVACGVPFFVGGDAPPLMRIERTLESTLYNQAYTLNGNTISFTTVPAGDLVIDLNSQTASVNGNTSAVMRYYNVSLSRFLVPTTGNQTVTGTGTVKYRERWL